MSKELELAKQCVAHLYSKDEATQKMGIEILEVGVEHLSLSMRVRSDMLNGHMCCHGGYIFAMADSCFAFACNNANQNTLAQGCSIEYLRPAYEGDTLIATAQKRHLSGRTGVYDVSVKTSEGEAVALFRGKSYRIKGTLLPKVVE